MITYLIYYIIIGAIVAVASWMYFTSYWKKHNIKGEEYPIVAYLPICTVLWPLMIISLFYEIYKKIFEKN